MDNMISEVEKTLETSIYSGETKRWNFDRYVCVMIDQHQIFTDLKYHGHAGINNCSKSIHLIWGIKNTTFDTVKDQIIMNAFLKKDYAARVALYNDRSNCD